MARTTGQPSTATRRNTRTTRSDTNGLGSLSKQNQDSRTDGDDERREGLSSVHDEQNTDRDNSSDQREFGESRDRDERESTSRNERSQGGDYDEEARRAQRPAVQAAGMDTFAPVLEAWKQVFQSWSQLTETMVKVQQDAFASMISGANAHAKDLNLGENGERAFSGSRTTASTPERIERNRR